MTTRRTHGFWRHLLHDDGGWVALAIAAAGAVSSYMKSRAANKPTTNTSSSTLDPSMKGLQAQVMQQIQGRLSNGGLPRGFEEGRISDINRTYDLINQGNANNLTSRGLGTSPIAVAVEANTNMARGGDITRLQRDLPMIGREFQNQDLSLAQQFLGQGRGLSQTIQGPQTSPAGNAMGSLAQMLAFYYGMRGGQMGGSQSSLNQSGLPSYGSGMPT